MSISAEGAHPVYETDRPVTYAVSRGVARITLARPVYHNAQNAQMLTALDAAWSMAIADDAVGCILLAAEGRNFSAGHDIGSPGRDVDLPIPTPRTLAGDHTGRGGAERAWVREQELYLGLCRRWRESAKPAVAAVQGACIAGGLMLAWVCDIIVTTEDASFADPVLQMGIPGVEYFAHAFEMHPRIAREFLFLGERMSASRAHALGMVNRVVPRADLDREATAIAERIAALPRFGVALAKRAFNLQEDLAGKRDTMEAVFHMHHLAHAHNQLVSGSTIRGETVASMKASGSAGSPDAGNA